MRFNRATGTAEFDTPLLARALRHALDGNEKVGDWHVPFPTDYDGLDPRTMAGAIREARSMTKQLGVKGRRLNPDLTAWIELLIEGLRDALEHAPAVEPAAPPCARCEKRARRFGDLCGRCADAAGVRPTGKIQ